MYFSLSGIKLCVLKKSLSRVLPMYPCKSPTTTVSTCLRVTSSHSHHLYMDHRVLYIGVYVDMHSQTPPCISTDPPLTMFKPVFSWPSYHWLALCTCTSLPLTLKANDGTVLEFISPHAWSHSCASADREALTSRTHAHLSFRKIPWPVRLIKSV